MSELTGQAGSGYSGKTGAAAFGVDPARRFGYGLGLLLDGSRARLASL